MKNLCRKSISLAVLAAISGSVLLQSEPVRADIDPTLCGIGGAVGGVAIGRQFGGGSGQDLMGILGGLAGAAIANRYCRQMNDANDLAVSEQAERQILIENHREPRRWRNPRYRGNDNSESRIVRRGAWGNSGRECRQTRTIVNDGHGSYVKDSYWCSDQGGQWSRVEETQVRTTVRWYPDGQMHETTTTTVETRVEGGRRQPPHQRIPEYIFSGREMERFTRDLQRDSFDSDRARTLNAYISDLHNGGRRITLDQLGQALAEYDFDDARMNALSRLLPYVDQQFGSTENAVRSFDHDSNEDTAAQMIHSFGQQGGRDRRDDGGRRREPRRRHH